MTSTRGQSVRAQYSKVCSAPAPRSLAAYRYSTKGYYSFQDAADLIVNDSHDDDLNDQDEFDLSHNKRSRWRLSLSQSLPEGWGSLYASGYYRITEGGYERNLSLGYDTSWDGMTLGLNYTFSSCGNRGRPSGRVEYQYPAE